MHVTKIRGATSLVPSPHPALGRLQYGNTGVTVQQVTKGWVWPGNEARELHQTVNVYRAVHAWCMLLNSYFYELVAVIYMWYQTEFSMTVLCNVVVFP